MNRTSSLHYIEIKKYKCNFQNFEKTCYEIEYEFQIKFELIFIKIHVHHSINSYLDYFTIMNRFNELIFSIQSFRCTYILYILYILYEINNMNISDF